LKTESLGGQNGQNPFSDISTRGAKGAQLGYSRNGGWVLRTALQKCGRGKSAKTNGHRDRGPDKIKERVAGANLSSCETQGRYATFRSGPQDLNKKPKVRGRPSPICPWEKRNTGSKCEPQRLNFAADAKKKSPGQGNRLKKSWCWKKHRELVQKKKKGGDRNLQHAGTKPEGRGCAVTGI